MIFNRKPRYMRLYKSMMVAFTVLAAASACKVTDLEDPDARNARAAEKMYQVHFVSDEIEQKTAFGEPATSGDKTQYSTFWTENDSKIAVSLNLKSNKGATVTPSADFKSATFDADFSQSDVDAPYVFYAMSPYSAAIGASPSHGGYHFKISMEQTPSATSCDELAQVLAATTEVESVDAFSNVDLHFSHVTAYGKLTLKNMTIPEGAVLRSVDLTANVPLAGNFYYNYADNTLEESSPSRTLSIKLDNIGYDGSGTIGDIWFACAPCDLGGGTLKVDVNTDKGVLTRTIDVASGKLSFSAGRVSKFGVKMDEAEFQPAVDRWILVTDASTLRAGDQVIIATSATPGDAYAVSTTQNSNNRSRVGVTIAEDSGAIVLVNPGATVEVFGLLPGYYEGSFYFKEMVSESGRYLQSSNTGSSNALLSNAEETATNSTNRAFASWKITVSATTHESVMSSSGTVTSSGSSYYRHVRMNNSTSDFRTYRSTSLGSWNSTTTGTYPVYLYRKAAGVIVDDDPILEENAYGAYLSGNNLTCGAGDQLSREYHGDGTLTFAVITPSEKRIAEFNGIPANPAKGDTFTLGYNVITGTGQSNTDYYVTVVKVDGPKVWVSAGAGIGFIVKK